MKLLIDENLSRKLVARISDLFPGSIHVADVALTESPDAAVWEYARVNGFAILTADADYFELATTLGPPPRLSGCVGGTIPRGMLRAYLGGKQFESLSLRATRSWVCLRSTKNSGNVQGVV